MRHGLKITTSAMAIGLGLMWSLSAASAERSADPLSDKDTKAQVSEVVVRAKRLDAARETIQPQIGASSYVIPSAVIEILPGGDNADLSSVILRMPGVAQDSFGQIHVRGDHGNLQYRLNGVILPEGLSSFGQVLSPRLAKSVELVTGALPAQYGLRTAGIVNIRTKSGLSNGGTISLYGGSNGTVQPSLEWGGAKGADSLYVSTSYRHSDLGIESPTPGVKSHHNQTDQWTGFAYYDHVLDDASRVSLIMGTSQQRFQIPNTPGLTPALGLNVLGQTQFDSLKLNQSQREKTYYAIGSYLTTFDRFTGQVSVFTRYSELNFSPDPVGALLFTGIGQTAKKSDMAVGLQAEGAYSLGKDHTLRAGVILQSDRTVSRTTAMVLPVDGSGVQTTNIPVWIKDNGASTHQTYSLYVQDEWHLGSQWVVNYGLRYDRLQSFRTEDQFSPRINAVYNPTETTTFHAGYARYFSPPPFELVGNVTVARFAGTTGQAKGVDNTAPFAERSDYFDIGVQQKFTPHWTVGLDLFDRRSRHLLDEGQFGAPIILTPFNYHDGKIRGAELSINYENGPLTAYTNLAVTKAEGRRIESAQFNFDPADLTYISSHYIPLDHDQRYSASAGLTYRWNQTRFGLDALYGDGLRKDGATPNGGKLKSRTVVNASVTQAVKGLAGIGDLDLRMDLINLFDEKYQIRDGSGVGVGAPQWGARRGIFAGISKAF